jgi:hypothetical protein
MPQNTHQLTIYIEPHAHPFIPYIQQYIHAIPYRHGEYELTWFAATAKSPTTRFVSCSPYSNTITTAHAKGVISDCLVWLSTLVNGALIRISYTVSLILVEDTLQNIGGVTFPKYACLAHVHGTHSHKPSQGDMMETRENRSAQASLERRAQEVVAAAVDITQAAESSI